MKRAARRKTRLERLTKDAVPRFQRSVEEVNEESLPTCAYAKWVSGFQGDSCPLLLFARAARMFPDEFQRGLKLATDTDFQSKTQTAQPLLAARCKILASLQKKDSDLLKDLVAAAEAYNSCWSIPRDERPLVERQLKLSIADSECWSKMLHEVAQRTGKAATPGLLALRDTIACIWGDVPIEQHAVETWVLFAYRNADFGAPQMDDQGVVGRLRLERIPHGSGVLYPDVLSSGYLRLADDFRRSMGRARNVVSNGRPLDFDVRWSIELRDVDHPENGHPIPVGGTLVGPSAGGAWGCALRALLEREHLERGVAITAAFDDASDGDKLTTVGGVTTKLLADFRRYKIFEVLMSAGQRELETHRDTQPKPVAITSLAEAYDKLSRWQRMTRSAKERLAKSALDERRASAHRYVLPSVSREVESGATNAPESSEAASVSSRFRPLSRREVRKLQIGKWSKTQRLLLLADSGLGKSFFLLRCEYNLARRLRTPFPIRVTQLSEVDWTGSVDDVIRRLAERFVPLLPEYKHPQILKWLRRLFDRGDALLLMDALDQTDQSQSLAGLGAFLKNVGPSCGVLLTGRPHVVSDRAGMFERGKWRTLQLDPFDEDAQRKYLGPDLARRLLIDDDEAWTSPETYARKTQWQDLLGIPFLLHQLRRMAEEPGKLDGLHNRHAIYREAIQRMVDDGIQKLSSTGRGNQIIDVANVERVLGQMAWDMQSAGNHSAVATGPAYRRVREILSDNELFLAIEHINLTTAGSLLDQPSRSRFAWRHRSFCEYFAGLQLARHYNEPEYGASLRRLARDPQWNWTFRFALSEAEAAGETNTRDALARDLIASGNPFLVADSLKEDRLNLPAELAVLTRWLVHHDYEWSDHWVVKAPPPIVTPLMLEILATMFRVENRNSRCLSAAWELIQGTNDPAARRIADEFRSEFSQIVRGERGDSSRRIAQEFLDGLRHVPPRRSGSDELNYWDEDGERHSIPDSFELARFPVTNELFELFDPHHDRTSWSREDRCPVVAVTWHQASLFCSWLGNGFALPTEEEWEFACRAGTRTLCWFGNDETELSKHAWCRWNSGGITHPVGAEGHDNPWGLYDMHGNVWEWTGTVHRNTHVMKGGSYNSAYRCRSSLSNLPELGFMEVDHGFRICRRCSSPHSTSSLCALTM